MNVGIDVLEIPVDEGCQLLDRSRMMAADRPQQFEPPVREEIAEGGGIFEVETFTRLDPLT
jgi:hypothetical protein